MSNAKGLKNVSWRVRLWLSHSCKFGNPRDQTLNALRKPRWSQKGNSRGTWGVLTPGRYERNLAFLMNSIRPCVKFDVDVKTAWCHPPKFWCLRHFWGFHFLWAIRRWNFDVVRAEIKKGLYHFWTPRISVAYCQFDVNINIWMSGWTSAILTAPLVAEGLLSRELFCECHRSGSEYWSGQWTK